MKVATNDNVELSEDDQGATEFLMVGCRAWDAPEVTPDLRPNCYSLVEKNRPDHYVRYYDYFLYTESDVNPRNQPTFDLDSSFILHRNAFLPDCSP